MKIGIGIDTGGTYTDAVAYDFAGGKILGSAKSLTTKEDLSVGILGALDGLPKDLLKHAEVISLSTTLATNACVEDKGGKAKLIFFGGDKKVIAENGGKYGLPNVGEIYIQESRTDYYGGIQCEPDWEIFAGNIKDFADLDGVGIIEMNAMKNGAVIEKKAKEIFTQKHDIPVVCGYELFSELNCLQRGSSTLLNAGLFPVIKEFLNAIKAATKARGINASIVIVRSDGSLMSEEFASVRPVETLLCGPAASVIGGTQLSGEANCVVIDMGGTTTDIALVKDNIPVTAVDGVSIGKWKTFVNGLYVKTFGLGGDSAVHYGDNGMILEEYRVIPLCIAAEKYPVITENLRNLITTTEYKHNKYLHEHYILIKDINCRGDYQSPVKNTRYTEEEKRFCNAIKDNPLILKEAAAAVGKDIYTLNISRLLKDGVVQVCGLTPTDIMHIKGDFTRYSDFTEASMLGTKAVIPKYSGVANAIGAVAGNVCAAYTVEIKPNHTAGGITGYTVYGDNVKTFDKLEEAEEFATSEAKNGAYNEAVKRGAKGEITVTCGLDTHTAKGKSVTIHLNTSATAQAVGAIGFAVLIRRR